ncbi:GGDEF domain-containing protein [Magnetospirillum sp. UT-4]|uniref:GGDEF domain-containing protein n=1 Tax=Magnetospirillum sp. UT-4 TaxID=2681467 RepID=UPI0013852C4C|nr:GGDEF domain-containing protein [Magnetospirillum sp. UT-4]CAA7613200.1 GGDEF domain protein [Magnetospirillum sp. UT-4]
MFQLSISRTLLVIYAAIAVISFVAVGLVAGWVKERSMNTLAAAESRRNAELVFQNLYSVMRKGWTKDEITELVARMNAAVPDMRVAVYRSRQVAEAFGDVEADRIARDSDPVIARAMASGGEELVLMGDTLRYVYPVVVGADCIECHAGTRVGSVNGVIDIRFPVDRLKVPLEFTLSTVTYAFSAVIFLLFVLVLLKVRLLIARPIIDLAHHIEGIMHSGDLGSRVGNKPFHWLHEVRSLAHNFNRLMGELETSRNALIEQSVTDPLTGLANRRRFADVLGHEFERARRHGHELALIMVDLDGFKPVNDKYGHAVGDAVLKRVAEIIAGHVRVTDLAVRAGGDEFVVLAPETTAEGARALAEKLAEAIRNARIEAEGATVSVGASIGVACFPVDGVEPGDLFATADAAMYADKRARKAAAG